MSKKKQAVKLVFDNKVDLKDIPDEIIISDPRLARALHVLLFPKGPGNHRQDF